MQLLKGIVIGLGVLIILGLGLLSYGFVQKTRNPDWRLFSASPTPVPVAEAPTIEAPLKTFGTISLNLAEGCAITDVRPDGVRAYLTIGGGATCSRIIVIDTVRGRILGTIKP